MFCQLSIKFCRTVWLTNLRLFFLARRTWNWRQIFSIELEWILCRVVRYLTNLKCFRGFKSFNNEKNNFYYVKEINHFLLVSDNSRHLCLEKRCNKFKGLIITWNQTMFQIKIWNGFIFTDFLSSSVRLFSSESCSMDKSDDQEIRNRQLRTFRSGQFKSSFILRIRLSEDQGKSWRRRQLSLRRFQVSMKITSVSSND